MRMDVEQIEGAVTRVRLTGDLDIKGAGEIDLQFNAVAGASERLVIDMQGVGFLASIGIRTLLTAAKTISRRGGRVVLLDPSETVAKVLRTCGADAILTIVNGWDGALAAIGAA